VIPWQVDDLGIRGYREVWDRQLAEVERRKPAPGADPSHADQVVPDLLLLVEHPHVITLGRRQQAAGNVVAAGEVEVVEIERGGDVTYHGPGQLVAYPIVALREHERDLHAFLRHLEQAVIDTVAGFGLDASREPGKTGVWLDSATGARRKLCSMGIACRRWVTFHGLALNVSTDLSYFHRINPCGFESSVMTSMATELGVGVELAEVGRALAAALGRQLGRTVGAPA
jgi:lipoyl(octanoyl) transferase